MNALFAPRAPLIEAEGQTDRDAEPSTVKFALSYSSAVERLGDGSPFLSRGSELEALVASIDECSRGRTIMVLIGGESGVGKSRLVERGRH